MLEDVELSSLSYLFSALTNDIHGCMARLSSGASLIFRRSAKSFTAQVI